MNRDFFTREEWEETSSSDPLLELADVTWRKLRTSACMVGGNSGVYHWEVVTKEEFIDPDYGYEMIHLVVKIQYRVEDQKQTIAGVDTLSMIENVRRELSKTATRVDILPQYEGEGSHTVWCTSSLPFDPSGENPDMPHTQEELEQLRREMLELVPFAEVPIVQVGCTVTSHAGPGAMGVIFAMQ